MRRALMALVLTLASVSFGWSEGQTILEATTGETWASWTTVEKTSAVYGYILGLSTLREAMRVGWVRSKSAEVKAELDRLYQWAYIGDTVGKVVDRLDAVFAVKDDTGAYANRRFPLYEVMIFEYSQPWWIDSEGNFLQEDGSRR